MDRLAVLLMLSPYLAVLAWHQLGIFGEAWAITQDADFIPTIVLIIFAIQLTIECTHAYAQEERACDPRHHSH